MDLQTDVLINGAGPTGLMMACQLRRFGVDCIIIDTKAGPTIESRALAVQARTLEIYEQMGIVDKALDEGQIMNKLHLVIKGKQITEVEFRKIGKGLSKYDFVFILEQSKNEKLLVEHLESLGGKVTWNTELINISEEKDKVDATCISKEGKITISAKWVIAADGARSILRHILQIPFEGGTYENIFYVADTAADWPWGHDGLTLCLSKETFVLIFSMKGENRYRVIGVLPKQVKDVKEFSEIQQQVKKLSKIDVDFRDTNWFSIYHVHHRSVKDFRCRRIFFTGDAAHVHSPVGGQGMNTGLQDAYNLGWKLAMVVKGMAGEDLLNSYHDERKPVAVRLLNTTDRAFTFVTSPKWWPIQIRMNIVPYILKFLISLRRFQLFLFGTVSQTKINYKNSFISFTSGNILRAGSLIPYTMVNGKILSEYLKENGFKFLLFNIVISDNQKKDIKEKFKVEFNFIDVNKNDGNKEAYEKFKVKDKGVFIIRPDNYIGYAATKFSDEEIEKYLREKLRLLWL